jgi:DNA adenine methylase
MPNTQSSTDPPRKATRRGLRRIAPASIARAAKPEAQPFLKWAGGKSQLLEQFEPFFPDSVRSYREPFLGGGAVFFHLKARFPKMRATLRDNNRELVNCYEVVRDRVEELIGRLDAHLEEFRSHGQLYYYDVRKQHKLSGLVERAARMIFLNKTCYNGLWRVNARGEFNVPIGSYRPERVSLYSRSNLLGASAALQEVDLRVEDFRQTLDQAQRGDFVYVDPPYHPLSRTANFTSYTQEEFGPAEQEELAERFAAAAGRGALLMLSNSDTLTTRQLYAAFHLQTVQARRAVNCDGAKRGRISELVALSYPVS